MNTGSWNKNSMVPNRETPYVLDSQSVATGIAAPFPGDVPALLARVFPRPCVVDRATPRPGRRSAVGGRSAQRFLPTRFNVQGAAIDSRGFACHGLACPQCHWRCLARCSRCRRCSSRSWVPRPVGSLISWLPRRGDSALSCPSILPWVLTTAIPRLNHRLQEYESLQFLNPNQEALVTIEKTEVQGEGYDTVLFGDQAVSYPRPFVFSLVPLEGHPNLHCPAKVARSICVYDNAGESFLPGEDAAASPVTRHLAGSRGP